MIIWNAKKPGPNVCLLESEQNFWATNSIFGWFHILKEGGGTLNKSTAKYFSEKNIYQSLMCY